MAWVRLLMFFLLQWAVRRFTAIQKWIRVIKISWFRYFIQEVKREVFVAHSANVFRDHCNDPFFSFLWIFCNCFVAHNWQTLILTRIYGAWESLGAQWLVFLHYIECIFDRLKKKSMCPMCNKIISESDNVQSTFFKLVRNSVFWIEQWGICHSCIEFAANRRLKVLVFF